MVRRWAILKQKFIKVLLEEWVSFLLRDGPILQANTLKSYEQLNDIPRVLRFTCCLASVRLVWQSRGHGTMAAIISIVHCGDFFQHRGK